MTDDSNAEMNRILRRQPPPDHDGLAEPSDDNEATSTDTSDDMNDVLRRAAAGRRII